MSRLKAFLFHLKVSKRQGMPLWTRLKWAWRWVWTWSQVPIA